MDVAPQSHLHSQRTPILGSLECLLIAVRRPKRCPVKSLAFISERYSNMLLRSIPICAVLLLCGCSTADKPRTVVSDYCQIYDPIRASSRDTPETLKQVKRQNRAYDTVCPKSAGLK